MNREVKTVVYDSELHIEAYRFEGVAQPFPNHFHEYYVIGFMEGGRRRLSCKNHEHTIAKGDVVIFNPGDNHACVQTDGGHWTTAASTSPGKSCWNWRQRSQEEGHCPDLPGLW